MSKSRLGKGVEALFSDIRAEQEEVMEVPVEHIRANREQPRTEFSAESIEELAKSIASVGIIQPIIVERVEDGEYIIITGERRYRAAQVAHLKTVPVICRQYGQSKHLEVALIENIQRSNLNTVEEARAYRALLERTGITHEELAHRLGKSRSAITNMLRILQLPKSIILHIEAGNLSFGHARALLAVNEMDVCMHLADEVMSKGLSVRQTEQQAQMLTGRQRKKRGASSGARTDVELLALQNDMSERLLTKVSIRGTSARGVIAIEYHSLDDLNRLVESITSHDN